MPSRYTHLKRVEEEFVEVERETPDIENLYGANHIRYYETQRSALNVKLNIWYKDRSKKQAVDLCLDKKVKIY